MRVGPPRTDRERAEALACLLGAEPCAGVSDRVTEAIALAESGEIDLGGLTAVWRDDEAVAAALWCRVADGSAFVWPPELGLHGRPADAVALLKEIVARARADGRLFAQSTVEPERQGHGDALEAAGFVFLADLLYLKRHLREPLPAVPRIQGRIISLAESSPQRFADVVERTYSESRDCPAFGGLRRATDALRSYQSAGNFTPDRWLLVEQGQGDVAVILLNDRDDESREIVYLGVTPEARRQGLGGALVASALIEASDQGLSAIATAVDAVNSPAIALYNRMGFFPGEKRSIYLARLGR